jgi:hypothetical protein
MKKDLHTSEVVDVRIRLEQAVEWLKGEPLRGPTEFYIPANEIESIIQTLENTALALKKSLHEVTVYEEKHPGRPVRAYTGYPGGESFKYTTNGIPVEKDYPAQVKDTDLTPNGWPGQIMKDGLD